MLWILRRPSIFWTCFTTCCGFVAQKVIQQVHNKSTKVEFELAYGSAIGTPSVVRCTIVSSQRCGRSGVGLFIGESDNLACKPGPRRRSELDRLRIDRPTGTRWTDCRARLRACGATSRHAERCANNRYTRPTSSSSSVFICAQRGCSAFNGTATAAC